tara:strand:+ start:340 stop:1698 length:1359 start_codon:yes stop_codon:yes gene_type:complete
MKIALQKHLNQNLSFLKDKKLLIAISGGIDSVVLTHLLHSFNYDISLAHCNFSLRGKESNKDELFIKELGENLKIPTYTIQFDTEKYAAENGLSTQMAARDLRYNWFQEIALENNLDYVITAHHKDDILETLLINLTRGTGLDGLTGIPVINENIIRPLLPFSTNQILLYATKNKLIWREDETNVSTKYVRNKIRHKVIPFLKEINPNLLNTLSNTLENLKGSQQIVKDRIKNISENIVSIHENEIHFNIEELKKLSNPKVYLYELLKDYNFSEWNDITDLLTAQSGKQIYSETHRLLKDRTILILSENTELKNATIFEIPENTSKTKNPIKLKFKVLDIPFNEYNDENKAFEELINDTINTISIDYNKINFPLTIRKWQKGDYFYPIGLHGKKKLSKFFKDEKLSLIAKENTWLLCSNNDIVWVIGKRLDDRFKVTKTTSKILSIKYKLKQ